MIFCPFLTLYIGGMFNIRIRCISSIHVDMLRDMRYTETGNVAVQFVDFSVAVAL